jgi:hypothetical protein
MSIAKWFVPAACLGTVLAAQTVNDLNGLVSAAGKYASSGMASSRDPQALGLHKIVGNYDDKTPNALLTRASEVQHWTFLYKIQPAMPGPHPASDLDAVPCPPQGPTAPPPTPAPTAPAPKPHVAVTTQCTKGVFHAFRYSDKPVSGLKSLDNTWLAVSLDSAVASLNANGYVRGFTTVSIMRPDLPNWPDDLVYVFKCPWERRDVAISCQTGALAWTYGF